MFIIKLSMPLKYSFKYNLEDFCLNDIQNNDFVSTKFLELLNNSSDAVDIFLLDSIENKKIDLSFFNYYILNRYLFINKFTPILKYLLNNTKDIDWDYMCSKGDNTLICFIYSNLDKLRWDKLSFNMEKKIIELLFQNEEEINWDNFSCGINKHKVPFFRKNIDKVNWDALFHSHLTNLDYESNLFIREHLDKIKDWNYLTYMSDEYVCKILLENIDKLSDWGIGNLSSIHYKSVVDYFINNQQKINWELFSLNINNKAIELLSKNTDKINWKLFSLNTNDKAIEILKNNLDKLHVENFLMNSNQLVIDFLNEIISQKEYFYGYINLDVLKDNLNVLKSNKNPNIINVIYKICDIYKLNFNEYVNFSNPGIFDITYDYKYIKNRIETTFKEELMAFIWNPERYHKWPENIFSDTD